MGSLILTADDYGACDFIDNGIISALRQGKINTVTAFVTHPGSESRMKTLLGLREELKEKNAGFYTFNIGLHFSITSGNPVTGESSLIADKRDKNGKFEFHEAKDYPFDDIIMEHLDLELSAQLDLLEQWLGGVPIDHVTNHHGICYLDVDFFEQYIHTISQFKSEKLKAHLPIRSPWSWLKSDMKVWKNGRLLVPTIKQGLELGLWKKIGDLTNKQLKLREQDAYELAIHFPNFLADTFYGLPFGENLDALMSELSRKNYSSEFMFHLGHPGETGGDLQTIIKNLDMPHGIDRNYFLNRTKELDVLTGTNIDQKINDYNLKRIYFAEA
jgi:predicted glycoside hydrolase/deacetylase ChbG (UPF0249 family)